MVVIYWRTGYDLHCFYLESQASGAVEGYLAEDLRKRSKLKLRGDVQLMPTCHPMAGRAHEPVPLAMPACAPLVAGHLWSLGTCRTPG